ncbi:hypothetical protein DFR29_104256 [Tahibacter aquaticus]|uniref:Uncharacterized protein n=1 Tax=Tahibacter aquaticus TaxID=520092 RepID=A0A4V3DMT2_9GAMM|nr:hypothetical protein [Tahibacter aquaticus]TDR45826.1 hypothetical protein DFR29_104256 [Tahibacter aquaticus]
MKHILQSLLAGAALLLSNAAFSCDITLPSGTSGTVIQQRLNSIKFPAYASVQVATTSARPR